MTDNLKGLFGGGTDDDDNRKQLRDFADRYTQGAPDEGYSDDEARQNFQRILQSAPPDVIQRAAHQTYQNLPEDRRSELNQMLQDRQQGKNLVDIQRSSDRGDQGGDPLSDLFGGLMGGGGGGGLGGLLGGLLGGGNDSGRGTSGGGGGLGDIVGGLFGGGDDDDSRTRQSAPDSNTGATAGGGVGDMFGGLLSGPMGKVIMGGIAAYAAKELMDRGQ